MTPATAHRAGSAGLAVNSLEIARVLADRDGLTFRAQGTCMYPIVRPGDVLKIRSCEAAEVQVGDIAVCRTPDYLFSHRVIAKGERDGRTFVATRADRNIGEGDEPTFDEDLLGVVVRIERDGREVLTQARTMGGVQAAYWRLRTAFVEARPRARAVGVRALGCVQARPWYAPLARRWYARRAPRLTLRVRVPFAARLGDALSRDLDPASFDLGQRFGDRPIERWSLVALVDGASEPAAGADFVREAEGWRLETLWTRMRYSATGLDDMLLREARRIASRTGAVLMDEAGAARGPGDDVAGGEEVAS